MVFQRACYGAYAPLLCSPIDLDVAFEYDCPLIHLGHKARIESRAHKGERIMKFLCFHDVLTAALGRSTVLEEE